MRSFKRFHLGSTGDELLIRLGQIAAVKQRVVGRRYADSIVDDAEIQSTIVLNCGTEIDVCEFYDTIMRWMDVEDMLELPFKDKVAK